MELKEIQDVVVYPFILFIVVMVSLGKPMGQKLNQLNMLSFECDLVGGVIVQHSQIPRLISDMAYMGILVHTCNARPRGTESKDQKFNAILSITEI